MKPRGSENLITVICEPFAYLKEPLAERLPNLGQKPITFMYGDYDWMERESAENLVKAGKVQRCAYVSAGWMVARVFAPLLLPQP